MNRDKSGSRTAGSPRHAPDTGFSIRARLVVMLALFALLPVLVVTFLASKRIATSLELMKSPGVTATLNNALTVSKTSLSTLENALHTICLRAAADPSLVKAVADGGAQPLMDSLDSILQRHLLSYGALYTKENEGAWSLAATVFGPDSPSAQGETKPLADHRVPPELPRPLAPGMHYDSAGWLLDTVPMVSPLEGRDALLVLGYHMGTEFFAQVQGIGRGIGFYRQLDVLKGLYVGSIWVWAGALLLVVVTATLITARFAARGLSRPLIDLADGMRSVARGDENVLVRPRGSRETKFLTHTFNVMVEELAAYKRDLARAERAAAWQDIARVAAHEIRNPLTPIQFAIRRIRDRLGGIPESEREPFRESLDSILGEVDTLKALASNFSQYAKLPESSPRAGDLNKLVSEAVDLFGAEKNVKIQMRLDPTLPNAHVDPSQMRMVLNNLLKNSVEALPDGGTITVSTGKENGPEGPWATLEVADTGVGMDPETLARATDAYFSTKAKGSGLGLAVIHKIVSQHSGRLDLESRPGEGTRISLRLPLTKGGARGQDGTE
jgi:nitrogen fixation/metabolism regulation signal transduction histidine kinase